MCCVLTCCVVVHVLCSHFLCIHVLFSQCVVVFSLVVYSLVVYSLYKLPPEQLPPVMSRRGVLVYFCPSCVVVALSSVIMSSFGTLSMCLASLLCRRLYYGHYVDVCGVGVEVCIV